jgi:hypothetical protein
MDSCSLLNSETDSADTHIRLVARFGFRIQSRFWLGLQPGGRVRQSCLNFTAAQ